MPFGHFLRPCSAGVSATGKAGRARFNYNWRDCPRSSVDRAPVSEAGCVSSILTGGAIIFHSVDYVSGPHMSVGQSTSKGLRSPGSPETVGRRSGICT